MKTVFITGAAGSLGKILVQVYIEKGYMVRAFDIDEGGLADLKEKYGDKIRTIYGNVADYNRVDYALRGSDIVIHTAAIKNILISEDNPWETIKTNVEGTYNIAQASAAHDVNKAIFISSDKAVESTLLYGDSKAISEKLWRWSNRHSKNTMFSIIRSGNFWKSKGNVYEHWEKQKKEGVGTITVTSLDVERYFIQTELVAAFVIEVENMMEGGETLIPKMQLHRIYELALREVSDPHRINITGLRPGEKLIEKLYTQEESTRIEKCKDFMVIR